jgi:hypothetical protein
MRVGTSVDDAAWSITDIGSLEDLPVVLLVGSVRWCFSWS